MTSPFERRIDRTFIEEQIETFEKEFDEYIENVKETSSQNKNVVLNKLKELKKLLELLKKTHLEIDKKLPDLSRDQLELRVNFQRTKDVRILDKIEEINQEKERLISEKVRYWMNFIEIYNRQILEITELLKA